MWVSTHALSVYKDYSGVLGMYVFFGLPANLKHGYFFPRVSKMLHVHAVFFNDDIFCIAMGKKRKTDQICCDAFFVPCASVLFLLFSLVLQ